MVKKPIHKEFEQVVDKRYRLENLINIDDLRKLLEDFYKIVPFPVAVLNLEGDVLLESHWEPICTRFHRVNPKTAAICVESDTHFNSELAKGDERHKLYRCQNGLDNAVSPIMIEGQHLGNFYIRQFLLEPPNEGFFRKQAQRYGFEEEEYLEALSRVPIISEHDLKNRLDYLCGFAEFLGKIGLKELQRDRAEDALRESEKCFRRLIENAKDAIYRMSLPDGTYDYVSSAGIEIFGYTPEELTNSPLLVQECIHPDSQEYFKEQWELLLAGKVPRSYEYRIVHGKSGETRWINQRNVLVRDDEGQPIAIEGIASDITERKKAEEALRESEEKLNTLLNATTDVAGLAEADGTIIAANDALAKSLGRKKEELIGKSMYEFLSAEVVERRKAVLQRILASKKPLRWEDEHAGRYFDNSIYPIIDDNGNVKQLALFARNITARKQAENKLKESEERFRMFFEQAGDAVFVHNPEGQFVEVNERACSSLGYSKDELIAISSTDIEVGWEPKNLHELWENLKANKVITTTGEQRRKDGSTFPVEVRLGSIQRNGQKLIMVMARDITVRKQLEEAFRREKDFTQNLIDTAQAILLVLDTEGRIVRFNPFMEDLCGYKLDEVRGMDWFSTFLPEQNRNRIKELFRTAVTGNETRGNIDPIVAKDGREIIVEWYDKTLKDADGNTIGLLAIGQDITSRKRAEEALKNAHDELEQRVKERTAELQGSNEELADEIEERLRSEEALRLERDNFTNIMNAMDDGAYIVNKEYEIEYLNQKLKDQFGETGGRNCFEYFHDRQGVCPWCRNPEILEGKTVRWNWYSPKNQRTYDLIDTPLENMDGTVSKLGIFRDVTDLKHLQAQLVRSERLAATGQLAASIAHEINSPLQAITILLDMSKEQLKGDSQQLGNSQQLENLEVISGAFETIKDTAKSLLDLNRPGKEKKEQTDVNGVIENTVVLVKSHLRHAKVRINLDLSLKIPDIMVSSQGLSHCLLNLVNNAVEAMSGASKSGRPGGMTGGEIKIRTLPGKENIVITVADTGPGIAEKDLHHVFDAFYTRKKKMGMGVGLSICHGFVEDHGGTIAAENSPEGGAVFTIKLLIEELGD